MNILNLCETAQGGVGIYQTFLSAMNGPDIVHHHLVPAEHAHFLGDLPNLHVFSRPERSAGAVVNMLREFKRLIRKLDPDICFLHSSFALAGLAAMRLRGDRRPAIYAPHGWAVASAEGSRLKKGLVRSVEGRLCALADRVICCSAADQRLAEQLGYRGKLLTVENAVPPPLPSARADLFAQEPDRLHLLFVGRLDHQKGFDILTEAMRLVKRRDLIVHVVGGAVRGDATATPLPDNMRLAGWVARAGMDDWYRSADALVVPSRWEGLPLIIPEALANGTPVLCSQRSGMESLIAPGETGDSFALRPDSLAALLDSLDKRSLQAMRPACQRAYARRFAVARLHDELASIFHDVRKTP